VVGVDESGAGAVVGGLDLEGEGHGIS
jgi:hypothetical protein